MYVRNVAGYNFAFKYREAVIYVPYDGRIYSIPDDSGTYKELKVVPAMHVRTQPVTYINKDGSQASEKLSGHKRRGRPPKKVDPDQPLKGVKVKRNAPAKQEPKVEEAVDNSVMDIDIDIDLLDSSVKVDEEPKVDAPIEEKVEEEKESTPKKAAKKVAKKRGRPRKKKTE